MATLGQWQYTCDYPATQSAYLLAKTGGAESCSRNTCRNFVAVRERVLPTEFTALLRSLGMEYTKDAEVCHLGRLPSGEHRYGGWFHFAGKLEKTGDFPMVAMSPNLKIWLCNGNAPHLETLNGVPRVQLEFDLINVPWVLDEAEPE